MPETVAQRVISVIAASQGIPAENITLKNTPFSLGIDSLDALTVIFNLEKEFGMRIRNESLFVSNIGEVGEWIEQNLPETASAIEATV
ncbi:MAG: acyl carrier protein [Acidobacteriota bacterium]